MKGVTTRKCSKGLTLRILKTGAGYYVGTLDEEGFPNCRISDYFESAFSTFKDLPVGARYRVRTENQFCCPNCQGY
jgi:hypothetical protein